MIITVIMTLIDLTHIIIIECIKGVLVGMPDSFMRMQAKNHFNAELPAMGDYAVANVFFPNGNTKALTDCKALLERITKERGLKVLGWRPVPVDNSMLGKDPIDSEPITEQIFIVNNGKYASQRDFERELFRIRKVTEDEAATMFGPESGFYINSLTGQTITYKGQLTPEQVSKYYLDLKKYPNGTAANHRTQGIVGCKSANNIFVEEPSIIHSSRFQKTT